MSLLQVSEILADVAKSDIVYAYCKPEVLDFTGEAAGEFVLCGGEDEYTFTLNKTLLPSLWTLFMHSIFAPGKKVIGWNLKSFFTYCRALGGKDFKAEASLIDLKVLEQYEGVRQAKPASFKEAMGRLRHLFNSGAWKEIQPVYKRVHIPLMTSVVPFMESYGLLDVRLQAPVYPCYEIEGQVNGRLKCEKKFSTGFVPHAMSADDRSSVTPRSLDEVYLHFDFKSLEVVVLAWLSGDPKLTEDCLADDVYAAIYKRVVGKECEDRNFAKKFFLPIIYGLSANGLHEKMAGDGTPISSAVAGAIFERVNAIYRGAVSWLDAGQRAAQAAGHVRDRLGRRRDFPESPYLARNFLVQAPAATICHDKLIQLHRAVPVVMYVHDGYYVTANRSNWKDVYRSAKKTLEAEDDTYPGLRLRAGCQAGRSLASLKPITSQRK